MPLRRGPRRVGLYVSARNRYDFPPLIRSTEIGVEDSTPVTPAVLAVLAAFAGAFAGAFLLGVALAVLAAFAGAFAGPFLLGVALAVLAAFAGAFAGAFLLGVALAVLAAFAGAFLLGVALAVLAAFAGAFAGAFLVLVLVAELAALTVPVFRCAAFFMQGLLAVWGSGVGRSSSPANRWGRSPLLDPHHVAHRAAPAALFAAHTVHDEATATARD